MEPIVEILRSHPWVLIPLGAFCIPIVAIVMGGIQGIVKMIIRHRERMALIQQGIPPDRLGPDDASGAKAQQGMS